MMYADVKEVVGSEADSLLPAIPVGGIAGIIQGVGFLYLIALGMSVVSSWFKGYGLFEQIKQVVAWSCFPLLFGIPVFLAIAIPFVIIWPDSAPMVRMIVGGAYLVTAGLWGAYIQWSGIRILFKGDKILPVGIIVIPYLLFASFVFLAQQLYVLFN